MVGRTRRGVINKQPVLKALREGPRGAFHLCSEPRIGSPEYVAAEQVLAAIDRLGKEITGSATYFHEPAHRSGWPAPR